MGWAVRVPVGSKSPSPTFGLAMVQLREKRKNLSLLMAVLAAVSGAYRMHDRLCGELCGANLTNTVLSRPGWAVPAADGLNWEPSTFGLVMGQSRENEKFL